MAQSFCCTWCVSSHWSFLSLLTCWYLQCRCHSDPVWYLRNNSGTCEMQECCVGIRILMETEYLSSSIFKECRCKPRELHSLDKSWSTFADRDSLPRWQNTNCVYCWLVWILSLWKNKVERRWLYTIACLWKKIEISSVAGRVFYLC